MHVLVDATDNKDLFVVLDGLGTEKLLGLLERAFTPLHFVLLDVECVAITDPAIVSAEDKDLFIVESEAAYRVACAPVVLTVGELDGFPASLEEVAARIETLNAIEGLLILGVTAANAVDIAVL